MSQSLFDINFKNFEAYFTSHKHMQWNKWLVLPEKNQDMGGKQGYVGLLFHPHNKNLCCLYKISKVDDNLVEHEYKIIKSLEELANYCPHFHKVYGMLPFDCNIHYENLPLNYNKKSKIVKRNMLLMQHIQHKYDFHGMIKDEKVDDNIIINVLKQVIIAVEMSQFYKFTHYDLHTENILIRNCNPNMHFLYLFEDKTILIPTYGYIPNIIDFGYSYCETENNDLTCTLVHTQYGFTSTRYDPYADIKLFFVSTVDDISKYNSRKKIQKKLSNICRNIFSGMNIQWSSGWDNSKLVSPITILTEMIKEYIKPSVLFSKSDLWFDTVQELINLPLSPMPYHELEKCFTGFIEEFVKFEERILSKTLLNYILKIFVKYVKQYRSSYIQSGEESEWAVIEIKKQFLEEYTQIINYHVPHINYEKMICSLLLMTQCMEGLFYDTLQKRYEEKDRQYEIMRCHDLTDFFSLLNHNFPSQYKPLNIKSSIFVVDHVNKKSTLLKLKKEEIQVIETLKEHSHITKYIENLYTSSF